MKSKSKHSDRFSHAEFKAIHSLYSAGVTCSELAERFGINRDFISGLCTGLDAQTSLTRSYKFNEVSLVPQKNICTSRLDPDTRSEAVRGVWLDTPLIASNMSTVCNSSFCAKLDSLGAMGVLHRAATDQNLIQEVKDLAATGSKNVAASIGVGDKQFELAKKFVDVGANIIVIDIANGYTDTVIELGKKIKTHLPVKLIIGNTTNVGLMYEVEGFADAVKCGVGGGLACETAFMAGFTEGQYSAVLKFKEISKKLGLPVISDGGIREPGDLVKAIAAGAGSAMAGSIFARCPESAGDIVTLEDGSRKKLYAGMASRHVQNQWRGGLKDGTCPEGAVKYLDIGEPVEELIERYSGALRSGITYSGGKTIDSLRDVEVINVKQ